MLVLTLVRGRLGGSCCSSRRSTSPPSCWEAGSHVEPASRAQIMIGVILIVLMNARPQGLLGERRVEIV